jgi:hypothetical protein
MILSSVRNQDLISFFRGFSTNTEAIYALREFFEANYHSVGPFRSMCPDRLTGCPLIDQQAP